MIIPLHAIGDIHQGSEEVSSCSGSPRSKRRDELLPLRVVGCLIDVHPQARVNGLRDRTLDGQLEREWLA